MNPRKLVLAGALLMSGVWAASSAHAGPNVQWQVTLESPVIRLPGHVMLPLPPIPVPRVVVTAPYHQERGYRESGYRDADGDGVPNRRDPVYNPRWDRDGDGIPNRYDARPYDPRNARGPSRHRDWHHGDGRGDDRHVPDRRDWRDDRRGR